MGSPFCTLNTKGAVVEQLPMSFIELLLNMLTDPNIIFLLTTIGVQAIIIEISSPGGWVAGFVGAICLALAAYGYGVLPINWFGIVFMLLAFVLFFLDVKAPTHGALTAAGIGSLIVGALVLFNTAATPSYLRISIPLVVAVSLITGVMFAIIVGFALRAQRAPVLMGKHSFVGQHGIARTDIAPTGQVQAGSELWSAELAADAKPIRSGEHVEIVAVTGLRLKVRKLK
jgi:membrane-bound serine protease (ClpP class)